jgi:hypothetical protein
MDRALSRLEEKFEQAESRLEAKLIGKESRRASVGHENKALFLWDKFEGEEEPNTFSFLKLAQDGGFSEVADLYNHARWISAVILLFFVAYNVPSVAALDMMFIHNATDAVMNKNGLAQTDPEIVQQLSDKFYFTQPITNAVTDHFGWERKSPLQVISALELIGLAYYVISFIFCIIGSYFGTGYRKWSCVQEIFFQIFPILSVYSAMRLLYCIVPLVLVSDIFAYIAWTKEVREEKSKTCLVVILFWIGYVLQLVFSVIVGFDTFLMKLRIIAVIVGGDNPGSIILPLVQFFSQTIGIVSMGRFVMRRLFVFIFGGEDATLQDEEEALMNVWNALLARRVFRELPPAKAIAVMASFCDDDFQGLVFNEDAEAKAAMDADKDANALKEA